MGDYHNVEQELIFSPFTFLKRCITYLISLFYEKT
jgi:hypothetical protein